jgi:hypothetical protein
MSNRLVRGPAALLTWVLIPAALAAAGVGLFWPAIYRETAWVVPQNRGQDLVTLAALALLAITLLFARAGSVRAVPIWIGLLGYVWYTYVGAAFSYRFNELFLVYVACLSLSSAALIALFAGLNVEALKAAFSPAAPRRSAAIFLFAMAVLLSALWLSQVFAFLRTGALPELIERAETPTNFVFVLDLGVVVPVSVLAGALLLQNAAWGYALASAMLMKAATMGFALVSMTVFAIRAGLGVDAGLAAFWAGLAMVGSAMTLWFISACRNLTASSQS